MTTSFALYFSSSPPFFRFSFLSFFFSLSFLSVIQLPELKRVSLHCVSLFNFPQLCENTSFESCAAKLVFATLLLVAKLTSLYQSIKIEMYNGIDMSVEFRQCRHFWRNKMKLYVYRCSKFVQNVLQCALLIYFAYVKRYRINVCVR